ncbi:non-canonical purine NTP pyrophosphatase [Campylobacter sp. RM9344]|uniref:dITP/XTP pyrophosphatase n=1 Tax=Campylobacter californiensis TaxID=1032243 RepID=A0AAW3ZV25_9BACT|nr:MULTISPECIES: non-canonical purine NTP pyrophosphatase [unclassified Campylobacter]MBE2984115.1 non-canonical purine NTP pyrophosphatase [Campylobacter sp. RM6883]MBE2995777.1 non-canonical purine NTP pyrophosphatase [Campylobacter sp. RM6913]MBE3030176.1 non-canonical purine NTP pyrophosphatase [Campylobacter sp. RM9344]MBE3607831.1 non-canonical purine NTP pyrophosphatase [Campylobacter sp. RM9337]QCD51439.1 putative dITP/XTP pyrophosphatase [Campylobacter sp. RM6914]
MKIVLATSNKGKVKEIREFLKEYEIYALSEIMSPFEIVENGEDFKQNALIKARAVFKKLCELNLQDEFIALSDDSGISVDVLGGAPGIYSARYSGEGATDASNRAKLIEGLKNKNVKSSKAHYTACIAVASKYGEFSAHGFMNGMAIDKERGENGFGYDALFIPNGFNHTLGELKDDVKLEISHRSKGLLLIKFVLKSLKKKFK